MRRISGRIANPHFSRSGLGNSWLGSGTFTNLKEGQSGRLLECSNELAGSKGKPGNSAAAVGGGKWLRQGHFRPKRGIYPSYYWNHCHHCHPLPPLPLGGGNHNLVESGREHYRFLTIFAPNCCYDPVLLRFSLNKGFPSIVTSKNSLLRLRLNKVSRCKYCAIA